MKLIKVIALTDHEWANVQRKTGDIYEADMEDDRFDALIITERAKRYIGLDLATKEEPRISPPGRYKRRDMRPIK